MRPVDTIPGLVEEFPFRAELLRRHDITRVDAILLCCIMENVRAGRSMTTAALAKLMGMQSPHIRRSIGRLTAAGLLQRRGRPNGTDVRHWTFQATG